MSKPKCPPNPLPCGCMVMGQQDLENAVETGYSLRVGYKNLHVVHCPLHKAAPDLLAHAKADLDELGYFVGNPSAWGHYDEAMSEQLRVVVERARRVLGMAEKQEAPGEPATP